MASTQSKIYNERAAMFSSMLPHDIPIIGAEIGVWKADFSTLMLERLPLLMMYLVDPWAEGRFTKPLLQKDWDVIYSRVVRKMEHFSGRVIIMRTTSELAAQRIGNLDYVFIDALHYYECVKQDLALWVPHVKTGGIVSGHDYSDSKPAGHGAVIRAVNEYAEKHGKNLKTVSAPHWLWYWKQ